MTLAGLRSDALLFGGVLAHPVRQWRSWHGLARDLFGYGGVTIDTPPAEGDEEKLAKTAVQARTVIQPDGDVLVLVRVDDDDRLPDGPVLAAHQQRVGEWYEQGREIVGQAVVTLRVLIGTLSLVAATTLGSFTWSMVSWQAGLVVLGAAVPLGRWLLGRLARGLLQGRIDRLLRTVGVVH